MLSHDNLTWGSKMVLGVIRAPGFNRLPVPGEEIIMSYLPHSEIASQTVRISEKLEVECALWGDGCLDMLQMLGRLEAAEAHRAAADTQTAETLRRLEDERPLAADPRGTSSGGITGPLAWEGLKHFYTESVQPMETAMNSR